jgi:ABC-type antimicrobial peptide transport system permease subunit
VTAVALRLRTELRSRLRSWLGLALLAGLAGGLVIAAAAGARRTETAVPRSEAASHFSDLTVGQFGFSSIDFGRLQSLPEVDYAYRADNFFFTGKTDRGRPLDVSRAGLIASADPSVGISRDAPKIVRGRRARQGRPDEAVPDEEAARLLGLKVGSTFTARFAAPDQLEAFLSDTTSDPTKLPTRGPLEKFRVVGVSASFSTTSSNYPETQLTSAFYKAHADDIAKSPAFAVYLRGHQASVTRFKRDVERLGGKQRVSFRTTSEFVTEVQRGVRIQAAALWVLAGLTGIIALLVVGQALGRQTFLESRDFPTLRALGMTNSQFLGLSLARAAAIGAAGSLVAVCVAILLSATMPVGSVARKAEPHPGISVDVLIVFGGAAAMLAIVVVVAAIPAWRSVRYLAGPSEPAGGPRRGSPVAARLARAGFPPTAVSGVRLALEPGQGATAVPVRTTVAGVVIAIAAIATALTFGASFNRLVDTPRLYGQNWDAEFGDGFDPDLAREAYPYLKKDRFVGAFSGGTISEIAIDGTRVGVLAMEPAKGSIGPSIIEGRAAAAPDEIVVASKTLDRIGANVGDVVRLSVGKHSTHARVVGAGVLADVQGAHALLGEGVVMTLNGYRRLVPDAPHNYFLVRFAEGVDRRKALASLEEAQAVNGAKPVDVANYSRVDSMPIVIGFLLGLVAVATLVHTLMTSLRRRRRDLAILKTLGFERAQISRVVMWQATTIVSIAVLIGIPLGIAAGRWSWRLFAEELGVVPDATVPIAAVLVVVPAALLVANLIAALPARLAAKTRPTIVLRAE